jgi:hypothetical protein
MALSLLTGISLFLAEYGGEVVTPARDAGIDVSHVGASQPYQEHLPNEAWVGGNGRPKTRLSLL